MRYFVELIMKKNTFFVLSQRIIVYLLFFYDYLTEPHRQKEDEKLQKFLNIYF